MTKRGAASLPVLHREIVACRTCARLVAWREQIGRDKRRMYRHESYWAKPLPGFGDPMAPLVIVGLAPGAHGANRTGRVFTGDRSAEFLFAALARAGLANQADSVDADDGLALTGAFITMPVRCVPPDNRPTADEIAACREFFRREVELLPQRAAYLALGALAWDATSALLGGRRQTFAHGRHRSFGDGTVHLIGSYHVSQQNTQTGRLTPRMFDEVLARAKELAGLGVT